VDLVSAIGGLNRSHALRLCRLGGSSAALGPSYGVLGVSTDVVNPGYRSYSPIITTGFASGYLVGGDSGKSD
jgi:hypothetical protein